MVIFVLVVNFGEMSAVMVDFVWECPRYCRVRLGKGLTELWKGKPKEEPRSYVTWKQARRRRVAIKTQKF